MEGRIFSIRNLGGSTSKEHKMVATTVDEKTDAYLSACALHFRVSKSRLLRSIVRRWYETSTETEDELLDALAQEAYAVFGIHEMREENYTYEEFIEELRKKLGRSKRGLYDYQIEKVIRRIDAKRKTEESRQ